MKEYISGEGGGAKFLQPIIQSKLCSWKFKVLSRYWSETFIGKLLVWENRSKSPVTLLELLLGETNKGLVGKNEATNFWWKTVKEKYLV